MNKMFKSSLLYALSFLTFSSPLISMETVTQAPIAKAVAEKVVKNATESSFLWNHAGEITLGVAVLATYFLYRIRRFNQIDAVKGLIKTVTNTGDAEKVIFAGWRSVGTQEMSVVYTDANSIYCASKYIDENNNVNPKFYTDVLNSDFIQTLLADITNDLILIDKDILADYKNLKTGSKAGISDDDQLVSLKYVTNKEDQLMIVRDIIKREANTLKALLNGETVKINDHDFWLPFASSSFGKLQELANQSKNGVAFFNFDFRTRKVTPKALDAAAAGAIDAERKEKEEDKDRFEVISQPKIDKVTLLKDSAGNKVLEQLRVFNFHKLDALKRLYLTKFTFSSTDGFFNKVIDFYNEYSLYPLYPKAGELYFDVANAYARLCAMCNAINVYLDKNRPASAKPTGNIADTKKMIDDLITRLGKFESKKPSDDEMTDISSHDFAWIRQSVSSLPENFKYISAGIFKAISRAEEFFVQSKFASAQGALKAAKRDLEDLHPRL